MALESLMERGQLADWREFARALEGNEQLARAVLRVSEYVEDRASASLVRVLVLRRLPVLLPAVATTPRRRILHHTLFPRCHHQLSRSG